MCYGTVPPIIRLVARTRSIRSDEYNDAHCRRQCLAAVPNRDTEYCTVHCHRVEGARPLHALQRTQDIRADD
jgi:hypothetical protein